MLDDYKERQAVAYNIMMNEINNNHLSHAYLIDENNNTEAFQMVMAFVKEILGINLTKEEKNMINKRIDDGNYPEIKIIEPDGMLIKKQQILDLQKEFSMAAVEGSKRIYIIRDAEKMRSETANSMLKFLEEPDNDIIAILMTNNYNNLLTTIISRCQVIRLNNDNRQVMDTDEICTLAVNFIQSIENSGIMTIAREQELLFSVISLKDREKMIDFFDKLIDLYYDIMKINIGKSDIKYNEYMEELSVIASNSTLDKILNKIDILVKYKDAIKYNVNMNLLVDSLIVSIGG